MSGLRTDFTKIKKPAKLCNCCPEVATHSCVRQVSWFRGDDESYLLCDTHTEIAKAGDFARITADASTEKMRRQLPKESQ